MKKIHFVLLLIYVGFSYAAQESSDKNATSKVEESSKSGDMNDYETFKLAQRICDASDEVLAEMGDIAHEMLPGLESHYETRFNLIQRGLMLKKDGISPYWIALHTPWGHRKLINYPRPFVWTHEMGTYLRALATKVPCELDMRIFQDPSVRGVSKFEKDEIVWIIDTIADKKQPEPMIITHHPKCEDMKNALKKHRERYATEIKELEKRRKKYEQEKIEQKKEKERSHDE